jgi:predicted MPP superfamily phosphohydrolase
MSRFIIFLALFLSIYGTAHLYLLIKWRRAFYLEGVHYAFLFIVLVFLMLAPVNARVLTAMNAWLPALVLDWIGYLWMGFVFILLCLALPLDAYHLLVGLGQRITGSDWTAMMFSRRQSVGFAVGVSLLLMVYGAVEAYRIKVEHVTLYTPKLSASAGTVRIVQISDVHLGPMLYPGRIEPIIRAIEQAKPDILVCTGDLIDGRVANPSAITTRLRSIQTSLGKFAVTGNHEYYAGIDQSIEFIKESGFIVLQGQGVTIGKHLFILGVDDPAGDAEKTERKAWKLLEKISGDKFVLLLKHRPRYDSQHVEAVDLQLSGHTHQGQIFPFGLLIRLFYPLACGLRPVGPHNYVYTSRGTGTWGPPLRILAPPEMTIIDLVPNPKS